MPVNKKGGGVNDLDSDDFGLSELGRLAELNEREPASFRELRLRARNARQAISAINRMEEVEPGSTDLPLFQKELAKQRKAKSQLEPRMALYKESMRERLNAQAVNTIGREFSETNIGSYVSSKMNSQEAQIGGMAMAQRPYNELAGQRQSIMSQMGGLRQESMGAANEYLAGRGVNPNASATIQENAGKMKELANQLIPITIAMQQLKEQGLDPKSKQRDLIKMGDKANGIISYNSLEEEMRSGKGLGSLTDSDLRKRETDAAHKLVKALEDLRNSAGKTKEELDGLNKNAESAANEFEEISKARKMGGNNNNGYAAGSAWASSIAQLANLAGNTIQTMGINQPMQVMGNIGGYASLENQKYDMWRSAVGGDMTARMNLGGWKNAGEFGKTLANRSGWVVGSRVVGGGAATVAGGLQLVDAITAAPGGTTVGKVIGNANTVTSIAQAAQATGEGIAMTAIAGKDAYQKISTSQTEIEANLAAMQTTKQLNHIPGYQLQQYRDYMMGLNSAAGGLGRGAGNFIDKAGSSAFMTKMQNTGVGLGEFANLSQFGSQNMGSMFNADSVLRAKHYENLGMGSAQENMQRMASLAAGGAQNPAQSMEKMLERAVGAGLTSSKALNLIAENTGQLVEQSNTRGGGFDISDTINRLILGAVDKRNPNQEFATKQAANTFQSEEDFKTNTSSSFAGQIAVGRLQKDLGLDFNSALSLQGTSTGMWQDWRERAKNGDVSGVELAASNQGIDLRNNALFKKNPNAFFDKLSSNKVLTQLERAGAGFATGANQDWKRMQAWLDGDTNGDRAKIYTGEISDAGAPSWVHKERMAIVQSIRNSNKNANVPQVLRDQLASMGRLNSTATALPTGELRGDSFDFTQEEKNRGGIQQGKAAQAGIGSLAGANFSGTSGAMAIAATGRVSQGQGGSEAAWAEAAAKSAADFGASAIKLDQASGKLVQAADKLIAFAGANRIGDDSEIRALRKKMEDNIPKQLSKQTLKADGGSE